MDEPIVILCTVPNSEVGEALARGLVEAQLAACVNALPGVISIYQWNGAVQREHEVQLFIKTRASRWDPVCAYLREHHPYEVPEILALKAWACSEPYARWIFESTR